MRKFSLIALSAAVACAVIWAADWPSQSGNPQRDGWAKTEKAFTKENAGKIEFLYKYKAENQAKGLSATGSPVVNGMLITYLGFKELMVFGASNDNVVAVDADLARTFWKVHFDYKADKPAAAPTAVCPGGMTAAIAMPGSSAGPQGRGGGGAGGRGRGPGGPGAPAAGRGPAAPVPGPPPMQQTPPLFAAGNFGRAANFAAIGADGTLHALNSSTGADRGAPIKYVPANSKVSAVNVNDGVVYATTTDNCGGNANGIYALDLSTTDPKLSSLELNGAGAAGLAGTAIGNDGTVYAQIPDGKGEMAGDYNDSVIAMSKDLKVKDYFTPTGAPRPVTKGVPVTTVTPVVFSWKGSDVIVAGGRDGRVYLLDSKSLGGADHHTPLAMSEPIATPESKFSGTGISGAFSSWEDGTTRWVYASVWGAPNGSVVAFKVEDQGGKPVLTKAWTSRDMLSPAPTITANGLVFALSSGESSRNAKENGSQYSVAEKQKLAKPAVLYVLDGLTGKELYSSGTMASTFSHGTGVAVANRRIYFTTHDNTVYALGFVVEQPQLTGK